MEIIASRIAATVHNILYVMAEGNAYQKNETATRKTILLFVIDFLQVVRVVTSPLYGWSEQTSNFVKNFDLVYLFTDVCTRVVPRYSFFILAATIVLVVLADTAYVAHLFSQGEVHKLWPIKVLRFLVAALVTTFFSSVIKWLLIPVDCLVTDEKSMSFYIHGPGVECDPLRSPEVIISIPTLLLAIVYCLFALMASLFWLEINPLSCSPTAKCTGRVEMCFVFMKIAATFLVYLAESISTVGTSVVLFAFCFAVFVFHLRTLPFHDKIINQVRGAIHAALMWLAFTAIVVSAMKRDEERDDSSDTQNMQWAFICCIPGAAILGAWAVSTRRNRLALLLDRLRGVWETNTGTASHRVTGTSEPANGSSEPSQPVESTGQVAMKTRAATTGVVFDYFYNPSWERKRAFSSSSEAYAAIRLLLHYRNYDDLPFLLHTMRKGMEEFPHSHQLKVLYLFLSRFVFEDQDEESMKKSTENLPLSMDLKYAIYAVDRKRSQELASASLGRGNVNAINLMEYDSGLERARKAHTDCVSHLRSFWHLVGRRNNKKRAALDPKQLADKMLDALGALDRATTNASEAYELLLHKYPTSLAVLTGYSHFCDVVLNDGKKAREMRERALSEEVQGTVVDEATTRNLDDQARRSQSSGSESASWRSRVFRTVHTWIESVMSEERGQVYSLRFRGRMILAVLVIGITSSFVVSNVMLYSTEAKKYMKLVRRAGELRINLATSAYELRNQMLVAWTNPEDHDSFIQTRTKMVNTAEDIREIHYRNYRNVVSQHIEDMYRSPVFAVFLPSGGFWTTEKKNLWDMVNDAARRSEVAAWCGVEELRNETYTLEDISESKRNIAYVHENWLRTLAPSLDQLIMGYQDEMRTVGTMITNVVYSSVAATSVVVLLLSFVVLRALIRWVQNLQHKQMACFLAVSLPISVSRKLYLFYRKIDIELKIIEDEEMDRMYMEGKFGDLDEDEGPHPPICPGLTADAVRNAGESEPLTAGNIAKHIEKLESPTRAACAARDRSPSLGSILETKPVKHEIQPDSDWPKGSAPHSPSSSAEQEGLTSPRPLLPPKAERIRNNLEASTPYDPVATYHNDAIAPATVVLVSRPKTKDQQDDEAKEEIDSIDQIPEGCKTSSDTGDTTVNDNRRPSLKLDVHVLEENVAEAGESPDGAGAHALKEAGAQQPQMPQLPDLDNLVSEETPRMEGEQETPRPEGVEFSSRGKATVSFAPPQPASHGTGVAEPSKPRRSSLKMPANSAWQNQEYTSRNSEMDEFAAETNMQENEAMYKTPRRTSHVGNGGKASEVGSDEEQEPGEDQLELRAVDPEFRTRVKERLVHERGFFLQTTVYASCFLVVLGLNLLFHLYPCRTIGDLVNLAPMIDIASSRVFHTLALAHLARELVLNDGFSRLRQESLVGAINEGAGRLDEANHAIRFGNSLGIKMGADARNEAHNRIMYGQGCAWRADPTNCTMFTKPKAADSGLLFLSNTFMDSLQSVVMRYAANVQPDDHAFDKDKEGHVPERFDRVRVSLDRAASVKSDVDVAFLQENFEGDMTEGFRMVMRMFSAEADNMLKVADQESQLLFAVCMIFIIGCYHIMLFRRTIRLALAEADKAKQFVLRQPIHTLEDDEHQVFASFFTAEDIHIGPGADNNTQDT